MQLNLELTFGMNSKQCLYLYLHKMLNLKKSWKLDWNWDFVALCILVLIKQLGTSRDMIWWFWSISWEHIVSICVWLTQCKGFIEHKPKLALLVCGYNDSSIESPCNNCQCPGQSIVQHRPIQCIQVYTILGGRVSLQKGDSWAERECSVG